MPLPVDTEIYLRRLLSDFGTPSGESGLHYIKDSFTGNGVTTVFNLSHSPSTSSPPFLYLNTVLEFSPEMYVIVGMVLTFVSAPTGAIIVQYTY